MLLDSIVYYNEVPGDWTCLIYFENVHTDDEIGAIREGGVSKKGARKQSWQSPCQQYSASKPNLLLTVRAFVDFL